MRSILLVAKREFRQIAQTRGFWVLLLFVPLVIAVMQVGTRFVRPPASVAYAVIDTSGEYRDAIDHKLQTFHDRDVLSDLAAYVERWELQEVDPGAAWSKGQRSFTDAEVEAFRAAGGAEAAVEKLKSHIPSDAPAFDPDQPRYVLVDLLAPLPDGGEALGEALRPLLEDDIDTPEGRMRLELVVHIPPGFGTAPLPVQVWTSGNPDQGLITSIRNELTRILKDRALRNSGLSPEAYSQIEAINAPMMLRAPPQGEGRERVRIRSILPLMLSYLLLVTVMTTGGLMLQGVLEERSNRLLESVLAYIRPSDLMYGKLIGLGAIGLTIILVWAGFGLGAAFTVQGAVADFLRPALAAFDQPWMAPTLIFYFVTGYLIISMIYLAIGALSTSLQDAQAYLMPVIFVITLPIVFMMISVVQDPNGILPVTLSWIPLYTPFAMLGRFGSGVALSEVIGTGAMLIVFVILETWLLGRLFQVSILRTGQPPALLTAVKSMFGRGSEKSA
jgi:ABC-2 type transport system permease protein